MKKALLYFLLAALPTTLAAQNLRPHRFDATLGVGENTFAGTLQWERLHGIGQKKKFRVGYGVRLTNFFASDLDYVTAPADLTVEMTGPGAFFGEVVEANLDTLRLDDAQLHALNAVIYLEYAVTPRLAAGFNIDAVGFTFGGDQTGTFQSSVFEAGSSRESASPTPFNALLIGDNDRGTLNSQLFVRYWVTERIGLRAALSYLFTEYTTDRSLAFENDRFRHKGTQFALGVAYSPF
ncbi:MAG: hypothetical protein WBA12_02290 [Catalinimonas sp.]